MRVFPNCLLQAVGCWEGWLVDLVGPLVILPAHGPRGPVLKRVGFSLLVFFSFPVASISHSSTITHHHPPSPPSSFKTNAPQQQEKQQRSTATLAVSDNVRAIFLCQSHPWTSNFTVSSPLPILPRVLNRFAVRYRQLTGPRDSSQPYLGFSPLVAFPAPPEASSVLRPRRSRPARPKSPAPNTPPSLFQPAPSHITRCHLDRVEVRSLPLHFLYALPLVVVLLSTCANGRG